MKKLMNAVMVLAVAGAVSGCASTAVKTALEQVKKSESVYAVVMEMEPAANSANKKSCQASSLTESQRPVCERLDTLNQAKVVVLHSSRLLYQWVVLPQEWPAKVGSIVQYQPGKRFATRVAAVDQRDDCKWTGHPLEDLNGRAAMAKGFAMGLLIVPAIAIAADETIHRGGVECEGWSYLSLLNPS